MSSQIYAVEVDRFSPVLLIAGLALVALLRNGTRRNHGFAVFYIGLLLFGLRLMGDAVQPLRDHGAVEDWLRRLEDPLAGVLAGAVGAAAIQSSSALMAIVIKLAGAGLMTLKGGVAVMLGAEIGTCLDTLIASVGRSREALRAGIFHLGFNLCTVALGFVFAGQIAQIAKAMPGDSVARQIGNAHVLFNVSGAVLFLPLIPLCAAALKLLVRPEGQGLGDREVAELG